MTAQANHQIEDILQPEVRDSLRGLEFFARRVVQGILHGAHKSRRKGVSTEFDHHKNYQPGDPLKHIDWKVSARHDEYFVKRYIEDTALSVRIVVDRSGSMLQDSGGPSKFLQAARLAASMAYLILRQRDSVGMVLAASEGLSWLPVRSVNTHLVQILSTLASAAPAGPDNLEKCLKAVFDRGARRGLVVVISDLMFEPEPPQRLMAQLQAQGHEVLLFQLRDPAEEDFPFSRWVQFENRENPAVRHRLDPVPLKKIYLEEYRALLNEWKTWAAKQNIHFVTFRTDERVETMLSEYLLYRTEVAAKR
ncbi:MAG: DUF58 domain-containing protein [Kiritimatiellia bacterium]